MSAFHKCLIVPFEKLAREEFVALGSEISIHISVMSHRLQFSAAYLYKKKINKIKPTGSNDANVSYSCSSHCRLQQIRGLLGRPAEQDRFIKLR